MTTLQECGARVTLATAVFDVAVDNTASFEGDAAPYPTFGADLAYLLGAIVKGEAFELWTVEHGEFLAWLGEHFSDDHPVWGSIVRLTEGV